MCRIDLDAGVGFSKLGVVMETSNVSLKAFNNRNNVLEAFKQLLAPTIIRTKCSFLLVVV